MVIGVHPIYLVPLFGCTQEATLEIFEDPVPTVADTWGTLIPEVNRNRTANALAITPEPLSYHTPSLSSDGTRLDRLFAPGGNGKNAEGGTGGFSIEWILAPSTVYLFRLTNLGSNGADGEIHLDWYEDLVTGHIL
jgi:hypothetical protein